MWEKIETIICTIVIIFVISFAVFFIIAFKEMLNDYRCNNLPLNEFYEDKKCSRYWDIKKGEEYEK